MTVITLTEAERLPAGASPVAPWGLLSRVHRPCPDHAGVCRCVGRNDDEGALVFWCDREEHHFRAR
jgi:hypothetical protein